ncbi:hypothetical protein ADL01_12710 [Streptomyces sp. NRRL WC-3618]|jgi:hypothetical protein|uniref:hypothetical protein n=1 Tax=Streptomyces sp. NRRL WC-3618 TaxID=1519490 RepID=UPI0006ADAA3E|nr:hypothetical protein [Streptomyces sp. NRRL WC-3618]KOV79854.1 hypothetical protein ADL01_12710 [Streptomyces sp. NRRL WC-3618]
MTADADDTAARDQDREREQQLLALEKKRERYVWYYLAYFLFGIHLVAFVMIYAVLHAPK